MGTAAAECYEERPGDGTSPGVCATDQITPERPEERRPAARQDGSVELAKIKFERSERTVVTAFGQGGWYCGRRLSAGSSHWQIRGFLADAGGHLMAELAERRPGGPMPAVPAHADLPAIE